MTISRLLPAIRPDPFTDGQAARNRPMEQPDASGALVVVEPPPWRPATRAVRPDASFVAHLIATAAQEPQTRSLRRGSSSEARAAYAGTAARLPANGNIIVSQTA